jgi:DNA-directed RNA polymerase II subunit RPB4
MAPHAAPSREQPTASTDLEAGRELKLGEFDDVETLSLSEARIVLQRTIEVREKRGEHFESTENTNKTKDYLELFAVFRDLQVAEQVEQLISSMGPVLVKFEKSQLKSLLPTCAEEARALIPSLDKKIEDGDLDEGQLDDICKEVQRLKRQAALPE